MISANIDLGQIIIASLIGIIGYFVKATISRFEVRLDKHDDIIRDLIATVNKIVGEKHA